MNRFRVLPAVVAVVLLCVMNVDSVAAVCSAFNGQCLDQNRALCSNGVWLSGHCPGADNIKCCAPTPDCDAEDGVCLDTQAGGPTCPGALLSGKCPGPASVRCCVPTLSAPQCEAKQGHCINVNEEKCSGDTLTGLCPGATNIRCCVPPTAPTAAPLCAQKSGTCINVNVPPSCPGTILTGLCPGPTNIRCCVPPAAGGDPLARSEDYGGLWNSMVITDAARIRNAASTISNGRARYQSVSASTGVPWQVIGVIHMLEGSCNFRTHLHNGDPLTARTVHVPAGRPPTGSPPFTWEESAADALGMAKAGNWRSKPSWDIASTLWKLEAYNGFGYKAHHINSPYLWAGTNHYARGKYVADGHYDPNAVSSQAGAAGLLKQLGFSGQ